MGGSDDLAQFVTTGSHRHLVAGQKPRVSLLVVKDKFWPDVFFAADQTDPVARAIYENSLKEDPPSMVFERIFHQPATRRRRMICLYNGRLIIERLKLSDNWQATYKCQF
jgi:hypothetical protein